MLLVLRRPLEVVLVAPGPVHMDAECADGLPREKSASFDMSKGDGAESSIIITACRLFAPAPRPTKSMPYPPSPLSPPPATPSTPNLKTSEGPEAGNATRDFETLVDGMWCVGRVACREVDGVEGEGGRDSGGICGAAAGGVPGAGTVTSYNNCERVCITIRREKY